MKQKRDEKIILPKRKSKNRFQRHPVLLIFSLWIVIVVVWFLNTESYCPPSYFPNYDQPVTYTAFLDYHFGDSTLYNPLFACIFSSLSVVLFAFVLRRWWVVLFVVPVMACGGMFTLVQGWCDRTIVEQVDEIKFDNKMYYLSIGDDVAGGMDIYSQILILHECELDSTGCYGRTIAESFSDHDFVHVYLRIEDIQLQVYSDDDLLYRQDSVITNPLPDVSATAISTDNVMHVKRLAERYFDDMQNIAWMKDNVGLVMSSYTGLWTHKFESESFVTQRFPIKSQTELALDTTTNFVATTSSLDPPVTVRKVDDMSVISTIPRSSDVVAFSPDGRFLVTVTDDQLTLYESSTFDQISTLGEIYWIEGLTFSPDSKLMAFRSWEYFDNAARDTVLVWNIEDPLIPQLLRIYELDNLASALTFSPDSRFIAIAFDQKLTDSESQTQIQIFDLESNAHVMTFKRPTVDINTYPRTQYEITSLVWSPDGKLLFSGDIQGNIHIWDTVAEEIVRTIPAHDSRLNVLAMNSTGTILVSGGNDGAIRFYGIPANE